MGDEAFATIKELHSVRDALQKDLNDYKQECLTDRNSLRGDVKTLQDDIRELKEETKAQTLLLNEVISGLKTVLKSVGGAFDSPRVRLALQAAALAFLGYITYRFTVITPPPNNPQPLIIYPATHNDGGQPVITVQ